MIDRQQIQKLEFEAWGGKRVEDILKNLKLMSLIQSSTMKSLYCN